jgi:uncharacterized membrane protein
VPRRRVAGGLELRFGRTRRAAAWGLLALYVAVFPANINQAVHHIPFGDKPAPELYLWLRLPFQLVFISLADWLARPDRNRLGDGE